ncbi:uncharacterized protein LOC127731983 [Mytilus californianus]|uniref:uncharacterized protein LOC127731983 n=1 Tax=Mytilus californianus TaxID=6549 RepID=UPI0022480588|nr:uncharacterized protein LOC127731983 [Mytilus californianus]XP_052096935.1 uncharacterized protein LOC127731983 [Mytilus californianus]
MSVDRSTRTCRFPVKKPTKTEIIESKKQTQETEDDISEDIGQKMTYKGQDYTGVSAQGRRESYETEHDNYIFIKFKNGNDSDLKLSGKSHFTMHPDNEASGSHEVARRSENKMVPENLKVDSDDDEDDTNIDDFDFDAESELDYITDRLGDRFRNVFDQDDSFIQQFLEDIQGLEMDFDGPIPWPMRQMLDGQKQDPQYPCSSKMKGNCEICLIENIDTRKRLCCNVPVCENCLQEYVKNEVEQRNVRLQCINCDSYVHRDEILALLPTELKDKFYRFLIEENKDPNVKTCPRCCLLQNKSQILPTSSPETLKKKKKNSAAGLKVICSRCGLTWCFDCHAPWHENVKCKEFKKGDKLVKNWAKELSYGQKNAVRCPKCKVFIQKKSGCSHMTCRNCNTSFCYRCGDRYIQMKLIGKHSDRFSPFGCKYNLLPDKPMARKAVRGSVLGAKIFGGVLLSGLIVAAAAVFIGGSVIFVPTYFGVKYYHWRKRQKWFRNYRKQKEEMNKVRTKAQLASRKTETALRDVEIGIPYSDHSDTMTSTESSSSNDHHGSTEVKVWVHSENEETPLDVVRYKSQEQQTTSSIHDNTVTTAEVTMEDDLVVLHVKTTSKISPGEGDQSEQEVDGSTDQNFVEDKSLFENSDDTKEHKVVTEVNVDSQGCFVKILGKLPVKWEKEEEKEVKLKENGVSVKPVIVKEKRRRIGTRRQKNLDHFSSSDSDKLEKYEKADGHEIALSNDANDETAISEIQQVKQICDQMDPYYGLVSMETYDTGF